MKPSAIIKRDFQKVVFLPLQSVRIPIILNLSTLVLLLLLFPANQKRIIPAVQAHDQQTESIAVVSAASFSADALTPDSIAAAFGEKMATTTSIAEDTDPKTPGVQLPTTLGGTTLKVKGIAAPLLFVSPQQINFVIPAEIAPSVNADDPAAIEVTSGDGTITTGRMHVANVAPAIFTVDSSGSGLPAAYLVRVKSGQQQVIEPLVTRDATTGALFPHSIDLGAETDRVFLILYLSGIRRAPDANGDGNLNETIRVLLNGYEITPSFAGRQPEMAGLDQINCEIPRSFLGNQKLTVRVTAGNSSSNRSNIAAAITPEGPISNLTEILLAVPPMTQAQWRPEGLDGLDIHAQLSAGETLLLGTSAGIYRSLDDGTNYIQVNYGLPLPANKQRIYALSMLKGFGYRAGTDGAGVWNSPNDGETWVWFETDIPLKDEKILALAADAGNSYAGTDGKGVYRSTHNNTPTWRSIGLDGHKITALALTDGWLFAATQAAGLQRTTNNGGSWQAVGTGLPAGAIIHTLAVSGQSIYAGTSLGLWRSTDNGVNWAELKLGLSQNYGVQAILIDDSNLFAGTDGSGILVSNDMGKTWKQINDGLTNLNILSLAHHAGRIFVGTKGGGMFATVVVPNSNLPPVAESLTITIDEDTKTDIKLLGSDPNDEPVTFRIISRPRYGYLSGNAPNVTYTPIENYNGTDSFTFITQDGKISSRLASVTINIRPVGDPVSFNVTSPSASIVGGLVIVEAFAYDPDKEPVNLTATALPAGATVLTPYPGEAQLIAKFLPTAAGTYSFSFAASQANSAPITREVTVTVTEPQSTNNWAQAPLFFDQRVDNLVPVVETDGTTTLYLLAREVGRYRFEGLYRSTDMRTWTRIGAGLPANLITLPGLGEIGGRLYFSSSEGTFRSSDKGASFVNITSGKGLPGDGKGFGLDGKGELLLGWTSTRLFRSPDAGETWAEITNNLPIGVSETEGGTMKDAAISGNALIVSLSSGIQSNGARTYRSLDNGATWHFVNADDAVSLRLFMDGDTLYGLTAIFFHRSDDNGATWPVLNPLFGPPRFGQIIPNTAAAVRNGVLLLEYDRDRLYRSTDKGQNWTDISAGRPPNVSNFVISPQWLYAITNDGLVYARPNQ